MKFISLFSKTPSHKRFSYEPRFYDSKEEERKEREERIRRELDHERGAATDAAGFRERMTGALQAARKRSKKGKGELNATLLRSGLLLFLTLFAMALLTWGQVAIYSLLLFIPLYMYLKYKK